MSQKRLSTCSGGSYARFFPSTAIKTRSLSPKDVMILLLRILGMAAIDGALAFDIAVFFAKLLVGFSIKKRIALFSLLILQDFVIKAVMTWGASWLAGFTVLKILGGLYLIASVIRANKGHSVTRGSLWGRLFQGMSASFFLNIDAAVSNGTLAQGHVWLLLGALGMSAVVICVVTAGFSWLAGKVDWMEHVENLIISATAGYLIAAGLQVEVPALMGGIIVLVCLFCFNSNRIIALLKRGWRFLLKRR
jgi:type IV secretory pathway VirB2 component (pilin)